MMMCIGKFVPMYTSSVERKFKYRKHIRCLLAKKRKMYRKDRILFLEVSRQYEAAVKNFLTAQEERIISSRKISKLYSYINSKLNHSGGIPPLEKEDGSFALSDKDKCDLLNQYFASVFTKDDGILPSFPSRIPDKSLDFIDISCNTVLKCLQKLPSSCTLSPDGFPALFLKSIAPSIALPLSILFTQSLSKGQIPKIWKVAFVRPLFKKRTLQFTI